MKRVILVFASVAVITAVLTLSSRSTGSASVAPSRLETASFANLSAPPEPPPKPKFTRTIYAATQLAGASVMLDACHGPIAVNLGKRRPVLVAEHNYCGGSAWMPKINLGDAVRLKGDGIEPGIYVVTEVRFQLRRKAKVRDLPEADAVLQTCVSKKKMVLVGLKKFDPTFVS